MDQAARARCKSTNSLLTHVLIDYKLISVNTLMLGKPEKGRMVENMIVRMAQSGQVCTRIGEKDLIGLLENVNAQMEKSKPTVKFDRRRAALDSDEDDI